MNYTASDSFVLHPTTSQPMHKSAQSVPTEVSDRDLNAINWSLMEIVKAASLPAQTFNPDVPATYKVVLAAIQAILNAGIYANSIEGATAAEISSGAAKVVLADKLLAALSTTGLSIGNFRIGLLANGQLDIVNSGTYKSININLANGSVRGLAVYAALKNQVVIGSTNSVIPAERPPVSLGGEDGFATAGISRWWCILPGNIIMQTGVATVPNGTGLVLALPDMTNIFSSTATIQNISFPAASGIFPCAANPYSGNQLALSHTAGAPQTVNWTAYGKVA